MPADPVTDPPVCGGYDQRLAVRQHRSDVTDQAGVHHVAQTVRAEEKHATRNTQQTVGTPGAAGFLLGFTARDEYYHRAALNRVATAWTKKTAAGLALQRYNEGWNNVR